MEISDLWKSGPALAVAVIGVIATLLKAVKTLLEFHDEYLSKRQFKRHSFLVSEAEKNSELKEFIEALKHEAIFRATFGKSSSPRKASAVMKLYKSGNFSHAELRESYLFLNLDDDDRLVVHIGVLGHVLFWITSIFIIASAMYLGFFVSVLIRVSSYQSFGLASICLLLIFFIFWYFGRDVRSVVWAKKVRSKLEILRAEESASKEASSAVTQ